MACRGVLFALETADAERLLAAEGDAAAMEFVETVEEGWDVAWLMELDKSWDVLHRCLTDGSLTFDGGEYPLSHAVLGGILLHEGDDYVISYVDAEQVHDIARALAPLDEEWLRERFAALTFPEYQGSGGEDDIEYALAFLPDLRDFYKEAARAGRAAIFTVDQ
ncbi:YfbM family protein [Streptomyces sp. NBC_00654]|uniref:YfbM family protein n=1 Tax=Streptomyces sp. NBC_00654 TaxID=2975799 RepID=UPI00224DCDDD|nr:YfbM family protein [Streptomyces sp. NBC_00654]MCX4967618.1 YfbM family protein [Streptomyces sp. NBC_00654]